MSLALPGNSQVNLQTGSATFSLPMFNWQDDKSRLNSVIALNYNSGNGLKVTDIASNVGQGWNLVAGGVITRIQVGEPDDQKPYAGTAQYGNGSDQDLTKYPGGYLYGGAAAAVGCPDKAAFYPTYGAQNVLYKQPNDVTQDRQLDYFAFQFNGKSGMFVLDANGGDHGVMLGDSRIKITFTRDDNLINQGIRTTINSFSIQDVDGLIYKFSTLGKTKLLASVFSNADGTKKQMQPKIRDISIYCQSAFDDGPTTAPWVNQYMANPYVINSWYLSEIDDPFTTRKIIFNYTTLNLTNSAGTDISYSEGANHYIVISYKKSITVTQEISSIVYPDGHQANFYYSAAQRFDYLGQSALNYVNMTYQGRYLSQYQLNTSYFILNRYGTPTTPYQKRVARLCLRSVKKIGVDLKEDTPPYLFDYYTGSSAADDFVPPPFSYVKDIWGYYNGNNSVAFDNTQIKLTEPTPYTVNYLGLEGLCFKHTGVTGIYYNAKPNYARNGLLKTITYPTGGSLGYVYAQNSGALMGTSTVMDVGGVHVSQTNSLDGGFSNGCGVPVITQYDYVMNGTGSASSLWGLEKPMNVISTNNDWREERQTIHFSLAYPFGTCLWHFVDPGILSQYESVSLSQIQQIMNVISPVLGVLSVISDIMDVNSLLLGTPFALVAVILDVITAAVSYVMSCPRATKSIAATIYHDFDLNTSSPLPAQFKRVEITESPGTIGKTVEWFTNADDNDYALWDLPNANIALTSKQRYAPWAYGLPKLITQYDVNGNKIKETQNVYDTSLAKITVSDPADGICGSKQPYIPLQSCRCEVFHNNSKRADWWTNDPVNIVTTSPSMNIEPYNVYTGRIVLTNTYERIYRTNDPTKFVQTETDYYYNIDHCTPTNFDVNLIVTKQSNGDVSYKNIKYTIDYNTGLLATMVQNNMVSTPVETNIYIIKAGTSTPQYLSEKVTEFAQISNGDIKPSRIIEQRFASPVSTFVPYSGPTTTNYNIYKIPQQFTYDAYGNLVGLKDEGSRVVTNIYDYNDKYITASVINADVSIDKSAYSSFESTDLTRSGWSLSGASSSVSNTSAPTGNNVFTLLAAGANSLTSTPLAAKPYTVSFWANSGNVSVIGGASLIKSAPTYSGFTYYEYNIAQGTSSVVVKNNSGTNISIDELRLYPSSARMLTTTYDPLIGKTAECDGNNRITYYIYDNLGRIKFIKDEGRNIVKMYEYNNVSAIKQTGCQVTYSNNQISEIFNRSNCSVGFQGSPVPITIPAGRYTSTVSQYDADIQAEIDLFTNGQTTANNSGSCDQIINNVYKSEIDTTQSCPLGKVGGPVNYAVPAGTYGSIIPGDADQQAMDDIAANAKAYANNPTYANCTISTTADWEWFAGDERSPADSTYCLSVNGQLPPHLFMLATDVNPNSPTYNQKQWEDSGPNSLCAANTYFNAQQSVVFTRNNCSTGYVGMSGAYVVPPGKYSSTVSQAAADLQATNDVNTYGQGYVNGHFNCVLLQNIHYVDSRSFQYSVRLTSTTNGNVYNFTANANTTGTLGQVPSDTYTVYICPVTNYVANNNYTVQGITQTSVICATFNNISITATANLSFF